MQLPYSTETIAKAAGQAVTQVRLQKLVLHNDSFLPSGQEGRSRTSRGRGPRTSRQAASSKAGPEGKDEHC